MATNSPIQWTHHTWNIARGCSKVDSDCKYCYMMRDSLGDTRYKGKVVEKTKTVFNMPLKLKEPARIFVSSLTDVFHPDCDAFRDEMWDIIRRCPQHTFQILTKRPERILDHLPDDWGTGWLNVWLGTSIGSDKTQQDRLIEMHQVPAVVRFLSVEPLHGPVDFKVTVRPNDTFSMLKYFHWVIVGGESGNDNGPWRYRECKQEWIENIIQACQGAGIPVFVKQLGTHLSKKLQLKDRHGGNIEEWPENLRVRDFPNFNITL